MLTKKILIITTVIITVVSCRQKEPAEWSPADNPLLTQWAGDIDPANPWPEYPRPAMVREEWTNLNGFWDYAITEKDHQVNEWDGKILVPYPIESALSGVKKRINENQVLWYKRDLVIPSSWKDKRIILNFEASDWQTSIWIDNKAAGEHKGGYDPFSFDISDYVKAGERHELRVRVWDPTDEGTQPAGKQVNEPGSIWYTPSSGIWQTVWMEPVDDIYIKSFRISTDISEGTIMIQPEISSFGEGLNLRAEILKDNKVIQATESKSDEDIILKLDDYELWSPDNPVLYDMEIKLIKEGEIIDRIKSYAGFRKISLGKDGDDYLRILLNDEFVYQNGPLDQGFWPDGLYTPPGDEAMRYDLEMIKKMGFNMLRKHVKVENRRFYYWCDKMGLLVWQDMPNGDKHIGRNDEDITKSAQAAGQFELELSRMIQTKFNHPSIIVWVPFNEGWGQYDTERITRLIKSIDPGRLVNSASGWTDRGTGDIIDIHNYPEPVAPPAEESRAAVLGEFGGLGLPIKGHTWEERNWGYENMDDSASLLKKYEDFYYEVYSFVENEGLSASVYTQITDVETETNGLLTYDRKKDKMGYENLYRANKGMLPPVLVNRSKIFTGEYEVILKTRKGGKIFYTTDGSEPDAGSKQYEGPFIINSSCELKVKAAYENGSSRIRTYIIEKVEATEGEELTRHEKGLELKIYNGQWNSLPDFSSQDPAEISLAGDIDHTDGQKDSYFGLSYEGYIRIDEEGVYGFELISDDGSNLFINDELLIDNDGIHGMRSVSRFAALGKGFHKIRMNYFQRTGGMGLEVNIIMPGGRSVPLSGDMLWHVPLSN